MPSILANTFAEPPGRQAERGGGAEQAVGGFVDGPVAAEGDDHVIALVRGLAAQLGGVPAGLGVHGVDLEAALQRVDDEMAQAVGDRRGVGVDDDQHAPLRSRALQRLEVLAAPVCRLVLAARESSSQGLHRAARERYRVCWRRVLGLASVDDC